MSEDISTKKKRVNFLKTIGQGLKNCYSIDLDLTALYSADGAAVPELLKLGHMLQSARKVNTTFLINEHIRALFQRTVTPSSFGLQVGEKLRVAINHLVSGMSVQGTSDKSAEDLIIYLPPEDVAEAQRAASELRRLAEALLQQKTSQQEERQRQALRHKLIGMTPAFCCHYARDQAVFELGREQTGPTEEPLGSPLVGF